MFKECARCIYNIIKGISQEGKTYDNKGVGKEMEINSKLDALNFLYNFEKYAERESDGCFLFMFPYEDSEGIDVFSIYKDKTNQWAIVGNEELSPGVFAVDKIDFKSLVHYVWDHRNCVNDGIRELIV
ncbi:hypothetical protein D3C71_1234600 [compost metagenome]